MMRICKFIIFVFILSLGMACSSEAPDPDRFKTGSFEIPASKGYDKTTIVRKDSLQIENYNGKIDTLNIEWKNNFNYTLTMRNPKSALDKEPIHVKITALKKDSYDFEAIIGKSNYIQKGTIIKKD